MPRERSSRPGFYRADTAIQTLTDEIFGPLAAVGAEAIDDMSDHDIVAVLRFLEVGERINREHARSLRKRVRPRRVGLRQRFEQAKALKDEAKALGKAVKADMKDLSVWLDTLRASVSEDEDTD